METEKQIKNIPKEKETQDNKKSELELELEKHIEKRVLQKEQAEKILEIMEKIKPN